MLTFEERRVPIYSTSDKPTIPREVTPGTPLESLNLNWRERDLREGERTKHVHRLHPYLGKFVPQLVEIFLRKYFRPGQTVVDPFSGSGTTLVQANELGVNSLGYDISAFNVLLTRVKTAKYDLALMRKEVQDILHKVGRVSVQTDGQTTLWEDASAPVGLSSTDDEYLRQWYAPTALTELLTYRNLINTEGYQYEDLLKVILSRSARSARLTRHYDLDFPKRPQKGPYWCYKHSRECAPTEEALKFIQRYSLDTVRRIEEFAAKRTDAGNSVYQSDSRTVTFPRIDGVITSPPYVGLIDYHEQHAYAYHLLGLQDLRAQEIGPAANGSSTRARDTYQADIAQVLRHIGRSMPCGGRFVVVANDKLGLYDRIREMAGLEVEAIVQRHVNRRTGRRSSEFHESIFIWRKP